MPPSKRPFAEAAGGSSKGGAGGTIIIEHDADEKMLFGQDKKLAEKYVSDVLNSAGSGTAYHQAMITLIKHAISLYQKMPFENVCKELQALVDNTMKSKKDRTTLHNRSYMKYMVEAAYKIALPDFTRDTYGQAIDSRPGRAS